MHCPESLRIEMGLSDVKNASLISCAIAPQMCKKAIHVTELLSTQSFTGTPVELQVSQVNQQN